MKTEKDAIVASLTTLGYVEQEFEKATMIYIKHTGAMTTMAVSESLYEKLKDNPNIKQLRPAEEMRFSEDGDLLNFQEDFWPQ